MKTIVITAVSVLVGISTIAAIQHFFPSPKIAYVDTGKLMIAFTEASRAQKSLEEQGTKWKDQYKTLQDSVQAAMDTMSRYFDDASVDRRKTLQNNLTVWNQRAENFRMANEKKMQQLASEKLQGVSSKINVFLEEYGKEKGYDLILGTMQGGNILYGNTADLDITQEVARELNERYK